MTSLGLRKLRVVLYTNVPAGISVIPFGALPAGLVRVTPEIIRGVASGTFTIRSSRSSRPSNSCTTNFSSWRPTVARRETACVPGDSSALRVE